MVRRKNKQNSNRKKNKINIISIIVVVIIIIICISLLLREMGVSEDVVFGILGLLLGGIGYHQGRTGRDKQKESNRKKNKITIISIVVVVIIICICLLLGELGVSEDVVFGFLGLVFYVAGYHQGKTGRGKHKEIP
ncbi:hypothetical protein [Neobacillus bataviensis]|uniref:hypothetical protein n=1 Tax=Neobacillus bataviensis TaxID=220685 RepID=UPI001CBFB0A3|nr:hypothetical protein [Neobacillus bataviensis]